MPGLDAAVPGGVRPVDRTDVEGVAVADDHTIRPGRSVPSLRWDAIVILPARLMASSSATVQADDAPAGFVPVTG